MARPTLHLEGQRFNRLTVRCRAPDRGKNPAWHCVCDCGREAIVIQHKLTSGHTKSCSCFRREIASETGKKARTHGHTSTGIYAVWRSMLARCSNPNNIGYSNYGGRGITVCDRWRGSFESFLADMGERPEGYEIDRIDGEGDYEPGNCRWVTAKVNTRNRRVTPKYTHDGQTMSLGDWADEYSVPYLVLKDRIRHKWSITRALTTPIKTNGSK